MLLRYLRCVSRLAHSLTVSHKKKLLGHTLGLKDLEELDPQLARGLQGLLDYEGDDIQDLYERTFEVIWDDFGVHRSHELKEDGKV